MKLGEIYNLAIKEGMKADPRGEREVLSLLKRQQEKFKALSAKEKEEFDKEKLENPYPDTRILYGKPEIEVKTIICGIDMEPAEILLAYLLKKEGKRIDLVLAHHPEGKALASLDEVMELQVDLFHKFGVPINVAESLMTPRIAEVSRAFAPINHNRAVDIAKILDIPFMCVHTPADNLAFQFVQNLMDKEKPRTVGDVVEVLKTIPEFKKATEFNAGPKIFAGSRERRAGKVAALGFTGGTEGAKELYERLSHSGVGTVIAMHVTEEHKKEAEKHHINVVVSGHIASDSLGMNLFLDQLERRGVDIIAVSGLIRIKRK